MDHVLHAKPIKMLTKKPRTASIFSSPVDTLTASIEGFWLMNPAAIYLNFSMSREERQNLTIEWCWHLILGERG